MKMNPLLYEINTLQWLSELSVGRKGPVTLGGVPTVEWDRLKDLGFDYVWLMGVWKRSRAGVRIFRDSPEFENFVTLFDQALPGWSDEDITGSPYSIASYTPEPLIGDWGDIDRAKKELNRRGMGLVLDFVPNHTAPDHPWVLENPGFYLEGSREDHEKAPASYTTVERGGEEIYFARGRDPYFPPWTDTLQINHFNPEARRALIGELKRIRAHADGLRCDMAMLVLNDIFRGTWGRAAGVVPEGEFWREARKALPGFLLIAEAYWDTERRLQKEGFDFVYDKALYDSLVAGSPQGVRSRLEAEEGFQRGLLRFMENHDEKRSAEAFEGDRHFASSVLFSTAPGMRLFHHGQLEGRRLKAPLQLRRVRAEQGDDRTREAYGRLLSIVRQDVFKNGDWRLLDFSPAFDETGRNLIAYLWRDGAVRKLVVVNLGGTTAQGRVTLGEMVSAGRDYVLRDELDGKVYSRSGSEMRHRGLHVILRGFAAHVFDMSEGRG